MSATTYEPADSHARVRAAISERRRHLVYRERKWTQQHAREQGLPTRGAANVNPRTMGQRVQHRRQLNRKRAEQTHEHATTLPRVESQKRRSEVHARTVDDGVSYEKRNKNPMDRNNTRREQNERASIAERVKDQDRQTEQERRSEVHVQEFERVKDEERDRQNEREGGISR